MDEIRYRCFACHQEIHPETVDCPECGCDEIERIPSWTRVEVAGFSTGVVVAVLLAVGAMFRFLIV